ncbi:MAG: lysostaphin resistance A-like protein [Terracidiphilus sp.]
MRSIVRKIGSFLGFSLFALILIGGSNAIWGALVYANALTTPSIPWALPALAIQLWLIWRYLSGKGWPAGTSMRRKQLLRANPVSARNLAWSLLAGLSAVVALAGFWIVLFRLVPMHPNLVLPARFTSSPVLIVAIALGASLLAPIIEESGIRGYLQVSLERDFSPAAAIALSSLVFALAHVSQGLEWPKLTIYFLVGMTFGTMACLNDSILPVILVHIAGDLIFFLFVWPHDGARSLVWQTGPDPWFWLHLAQTVGFGALSVLAFIKLAHCGERQMCSVPYSGSMRPAGLP